MFLWAEFSEMCKLILNNSSENILFLNDVIQFYKFILLFTVLPA